MVIALFSPLFLDHSAHPSNSSKTFTNVKHVDSTFHFSKPSPTPEILSHSGIHKNTPIPGIGETPFSVENGKYAITTNESLCGAWQQLG